MILIKITLNIFMFELIFNLFFTLTEESKYSFHSLFYLFAKTNISKDSLKYFLIIDLRSFYFIEILHLIST